MLFATSSRPFGLFVPVEMAAEMEHAHPMEISIQGFDATHLLQLSTNRFFCLNGKQPSIFTYPVRLNDDTWNKVKENVIAISPLGLKCKTNQIVF